ncbi:MAG: IS630 family transposase [Pirellulales bacterium]|nr:IS630 family transposase [Pirellulales bacterium]
MKKKYIVTLRESERETLQAMLSRGKAAARKLVHARILLKADAGPGGPAWRDQQIADGLEIGRATVERVRREFVEEGLEAALERRKPRRQYARVLDGDGEAHLIALACQKPPEGRSRWTLRLLADRMVRLEYVDEVSKDTVSRVLKKNERKPWLSKQWCIPPKANAEFVCKMEGVLEVYKRPYDPQRPVVCLDETSKQWIGEVAHYDYEYVRNGVANLFMISEPRAGQREVEVTDRRTKKDYARCLRKIADEMYPDAEVIVLVQDNLNTHSPASLYEAFEPMEARRLMNWFEVHYTPKHGSWLDMAEIELGILGRQCLARRIDNVKGLCREVAAWKTDRNVAGTKVNWQFTTADARIKLRRLYPSFEE